MNIQDRTSRSKAPQSIDIVLFCSLGVAFWLIFLLLIRYWGEYLFIVGVASQNENRNPWQLGLFLGSIPVAWALVKIGTTIGKVEGKRVLKATAMMSITAMLLDGIALTWFQNWYGLEPTQLLLAAAWLLWGVAICLAISYWESEKH